MLYKKGGMEKAGNYRPIALVCHAVKLITSILAWRLNEVVNELVPHNQNGFVKGRLIKDNVLNVLTAMTAKGGIVTLLAFKKAFDSMRHTYMDIVLEGMGIGPEFPKWIKAFRDNCSANVIVNNSQSDDSFPITRGVRQGDPLSPLHSWNSSFAISDPKGDQRGHSSQANYQMLGICR
eukprot:Nk52_evm22s241 gene=Nk52_evmTU22s241